MVDLKPFQTKTPQQAPRCPNCRYLLFRITEPVCPECGFEFETAAEVRRARWYSDDNLPNRRAYERARTWGIAGAALTLIGALLTLIGSWQGSAVSLIGATKLTILGTITTLGIAVPLWYRAPVHRRLFLLGALWFAVGMLTAFFGY